MIYYVYLAFDSTVTMCVLYVLVLFVSNFLTDRERATLVATLHLQAEDRQCHRDVAEAMPLIDAGKLREQRAKGKTDLWAKTVGRLTMPPPPYEIQMEIQNSL